MSAYRTGASIDDAGQLIEFDRKLRLLVLEGVEQIELALRTQIGYSLGQVGAFAHEAPSTYVYLPSDVCETYTQFGEESSDVGNQGNLDLALL